MNLQVKKIQPEIHVEELEPKVAKPKRVFQAKKNNLTTTDLDDNFDFFSETKQTKLSDKFNKSKEASRNNLNNFTKDLLKNLPKEASGEVTRKEVKSTNILTRKMKILRKTIIYIAHMEFNSRQ
jgi:hypothetical protein